MFRRRRTELHGSRISRSQLVLVFSAVARIALTLAATMLLGRVLSAADFGFFGFVVVLLALGREIMELGTSSLATREIALQPDSERGVLESLVSLRAVVGVVYAALVLAVALGQQTAGERLILIAVALLVPFLSIGALTVAFQLRQEQGPPAAIAVVLQAAFLTACIMLYAAEAPAWSYALTAVAREAAGMAWLARLAARRLGYATRPRWNVDALRRFAHKASAFGSAAAVYKLYFFLGPLLVWFMLTPAEMGAYSAAFRPISVLLAFPWLLTIPLLPALTYLAAHNRSAFEQQAAYLMPLSLGLGAIAAIAGFELSGDILFVLYGDRYLSGDLAADDAFGLLCLSLAFSMATAVVMTLLIADRRERLLLPLALSGLLINLSCNILLLPVYGFTAAALATLITEVGVCSIGSVMLVRASRLRRFDAGTIWFLGPALLLGVGIQLLPSTFGWQRLTTALLVCCAAAMVLFLLPNARRGRQQLSALDVRGPTT